ncbi:hypothetical protein AAG906_001105 [Vitis piasezkii]
MQGEKQGEEENRVKKTGIAAAVFYPTFGTLPDVHFLHSIYHFKAQEVKNPMLQTVCDLELKRRSYGRLKQITPKCCEIRHLLREFRKIFQPNFEDFSSEDERLSFLSLGVRKAGRHPLVISCELLTGNPRLKIILNVVYAILNTIAEEAMNFMSYMAEVSRGWDEPNARDMGE